MPNNIKVIFIHGNGGTTAQDTWIPEVSMALEDAGITVIAETFPDNVRARSSKWLPFIKHLGADSNTILVGHSSGALAAMRYAESNQLLGSILIGAAHTDLGDVTEKASGYFDKTWNWAKIRTNQQWILQFGSTDDPYIPIDEQRYVRDNVKSEYHEFHDRGHFLSDSFPELTNAILEKIQ